VQELGGETFVSAEVMCRRIHVPAAVAEDILIPLTRSVDVVVMRAPPGDCDPAAVVKGPHLQLADRRLPQLADGRLGSAVLETPYPPCAKVALVGERQSNLENDTSRDRNREC